MDDLLLSLSNGTRLYSPGSLRAITTYVLLEQESWFEKEFAFIPHLLREGMHAVDIGANLGTFSLAMGLAVGPTGRISAYEPTTSTRDRLIRSRDANGMTQIEISDRALSDGERTGRIVFGSSSELNHLGDAGSGEGEEVEISSLDAEAKGHGWSEPYFMKVDAEGEEIPILQGGSRLLNEWSPLLMLELKAGNAVNLQLVEAANAIGYRPYRLLPGAPVLVPLSEDYHGSELNFFAAKDDRAAELEARGLLVRSIPAFSVSEAEVAQALAKLRAMPFAAAFAAQFDPGVTLDPRYAQSLACLSVWEDESQPVPRRVAALEHGHSVLRALCESGGRAARLITLARLAIAWGDRGLAHEALDAVIEVGRKGNISLGEPFWPASARYDAVPVAGRPAQWFMAGACEAFETVRAHSTAFSKPSKTLGWLSGSGYCSLEMIRRHCLSELKRNRTPELPPSVLEDSPDNRNAALWRDGTVSRLAEAAQ